MWGESRHGSSLTGLEEGVVNGKCVSWDLLGWAVSTESTRNWGNKVVTPHDSPVCSYCPRESEPQNSVLDAGLIAEKKEEGVGQFLKGPFLASIFCWLWTDDHCIVQSQPSSQLLNSYPSRKARGQISELPFSIPPASPGSLKNQGSFWRWWRIPWPVTPELSRWGQEDLKFKVITHS